MFVRLRTRRNHITATALVVVSLLNAVLFSNFHAAERGWACALFSPGQKAVAVAGGVIDRIGEWLKAVDGQARELRKAREQISLLRQQIEIKNAEIIEKNRALEKMRETLEFAREHPEAEKLKAIEAKVVGRDAANRPGLVILDHGSGQNVEPGAGVISGRAVVGIVSETSHSACVVRLITHPLCRIAAYLPRTAESRHVTGTLSDTLRMLDVHQGRPRKEDIVLTSGEMGVFPRGLLIGSVADARREAGSLVYDTDVSPAVALPTVHDVLILPPRHGDAREMIRQMRED